jgi:hypothetical protein
MFLAKLKLVVGTVMVVAALGAGGVAYQVSGPRPAQAAPESKPQSELEALKKENELLKFNLQVVLEKARALEADVRALKQQAKTATATINTINNYSTPLHTIRTFVPLTTQGPVHLRWAVDTSSSALQDPVQQAEAALKALREAKDPEAKRRAAAALEAAAKKLKEQPQKQPEKPSKSQEGK